MPSGRRPYRNAMEPFAQGLGGAFAGGLQGGMNAALAARAEQGKEDALLRRLLMQSQLEQQAQGTRLNREAVLEGIGQLDVPIDTRNAAIDFTSWPPATQDALRADVGNVGVNEVDARTRAALTALSSGERVKKGAARTAGVNQSLFDIGQRLVASKSGNQGLQALMEQIKTMNPEEAKRFYVDFADQLRNAADLEGIAWTDAEIEKTLRASFQPSKVSAAQTPPPKAPVKRTLFGR